jgi:hypothetical protein
MITSVVTAISILLIIVLGFMFIAIGETKKK